MAQAPQTGMEKAEMKQLLSKSKQEPVNAAFGQSGAKGGEGFAVLMLHKSKGPKALNKELEDKFADAKNTRWGTAVVEPEVDSALVKFVINKAVGGMAKRLARTLKGTGYRKVEIYLEDGSLCEGAADEEEEGAPAKAAAAPPPPPPPPAAPELNLATLQKALAALIPRIGPAAGENAGLRAQLAKFAADANAGLKSNDFIGAQAIIVQLRDALDAAPSGASPNGASPNGASPNGASLNGAQANGAEAEQKGAPKAGTEGAVAYAKSRLAWIATRKKLESEIEKLRAALADAYKSETVAGDIEKSYRERVAPLLANLDESLADKLDEATNAAEPAARAKLVGEAKEIMARYQAFIAGEPLIADLDANPFVPLAIQKTLSATLTGLSAAVR